MPASVAGRVPANDALLLLQFKVRIARQTEIAERNARLAAGRASEAASGGGPSDTVSVDGLPAVASGGGPSFAVSAGGRSAVVSGGGPSGATAGTGAGRGFAVEGCDSASSTQNRARESRHRCRRSLRRRGLDDGHLDALVTANSRQVDNCDVVRVRQRRPLRHAVVNRDLDRLQTAVAAKGLRRFAVAVVDQETPELRAIVDVHLDPSGPRRCQARPRTKPCSPCRRKCFEGRRRLASRLKGGARREDH